MFRIEVLGPGSGSQLGNPVGPTALPGPGSSSAQPDPRIRDCLRTSKLLGSSKGPEAPTGPPEASKDLSSMVKVLEGPPPINSDTHLGQDAPDYIVALIAVCTPNLRVLGNGCKLFLRLTASSVFFFFVLPAFCRFLKLSCLLCMHVIWTSVSLVCKGSEFSSTPSVVLVQCAD